MLLPPPREDATSHKTTRRALVASTGAVLATGVVAALAGRSILLRKQGGEEPIPEDEQDTFVYATGDSSPEPPVYGPGDTLWIDGVEVCFDVTDHRFYVEDPRFEQDWAWTTVPTFAMEGAMEQTRRFIDEVEVPNKHHDVMRMIGLAGKIHSPFGEIGGTYRTRYRAVFAATLDRYDGATKRVHQVLHHEFSSLLIYEGLLDLEEWKRVSGDVEYTHDMNVDKNYRLPGRKEFETGFISVYGMTNPENDLNEFVTMLVTHPVPLLEDFGVKYPLLGKKARLILKWYRALGIRIPKLDEREAQNTP